MLRRRNTHRREGFSLVEILVVVTIIAILVSLLVSVAMKAIGVGPKADTGARISVIGNAIGTFKGNQSFGQVNYIPAGRMENGQWLPFRLRNQYANPTSATDPGPNSFEAQYLQQVFGGGRGLNLNDLGHSNKSLSADLDANQTLTFFLGGIPEISGQVVLFTGFSSNPQAPFTQSGVNPGEIRRGPLLDLGGTKPKYLVDPTNGFPRMIDGYGNPFAYFTSYDGKPPRAGFPYGGWGNGNFTSTKPGGPMGNVIPYSRTVGTVTQFENPSGFQLISAGKDGVFGTTGDWTSVTGTPGEDDQANFTDRLLGAGPR
jgi:prepilin-type N-terminal cleavage/methylation domain-containing protein